MESPADQSCVRMAALEDISQLCGLLSALFAQEVEFQPDAARQANGLRLILEQPELGRIYCATINAEIVAMVSILFTVSTAEGGRVAWLEDMVVHPDMRGLGIGGKLIDEAIRSARDADCLRITLLTDSTNDGAMQFYERTGFVRSKMVPFRLNL